jgi:hypothetical protein
MAGIFTHPLIPSQEGKQNPLLGGGGFRGWARQHLEPDSESFKVKRPMLIV